MIFDKLIALLWIYTLCRLNIPKFRRNALSPSSGSLNTTWILKRCGGDLSVRHSTLTVLGQTVSHRPAEFSDLAEGSNMFLRQAESLCYYTRCWNQKLDHYQRLMWKFWCM